MTYRKIRLGQLGNDPTVAFAVQELVRSLKQMDSALLTEVLRADEASTGIGNIIWVGLDKSFAHSIPEVEDPELDDAISIAVTDAGGYITGSNNRSVLIAVYRFLKALGCEWVRPGKEGERIPTKEIKDLCVHIQERASYRHRGVCIEGATAYENVADMIDYLPKQGLNEYYIQFMVPMAFFERWYMPERNPYQKHEPLTREEVRAMTVALEEEIARRGLRYHKTGHGWTCEPFGLDGTGWGEMDASQADASIVQYTALVNGKRGVWKNKPLFTNLCYSNPEVRNKMTQAVTDYCLKNPHVDVLHFWLADEINNQCECENCVKMRPADWYIKMLNELDEKMTAAGLNTKVVFLLYFDLLWTPEQEKLNNPDRFILMFAPISRIYGQNYVDHLDAGAVCAPYVRNELDTPKSLSADLAYLRQWQTKFSGDSFVYDYHLMWAHVADPGYERCAKNLFEDMKSLHRLGLNGMVSCQVQRCAFPTALPMHMMAKALWDKDSDFEENVQAYYRRAFGKDGDAVHRYLAAVSDLIKVYESPALGHRVFDRRPMCGDYDAVEKTIGDIVHVIERNLAGTLAAEWEALKIHTEYVHLFVRSLQDLEAGEMQTLKETVNQLGELINRNEPRLQKQLDGQNTHRILFRRFGVEEIPT